MKRYINVFIIVLFVITTLGLKSFCEVLQEITVKEGDTLWGVANYYLKNPRRWPEILKHNKLPSSDPNIILPGMKIRVPILLIKEHLRAARLIYILNDVRFRRREESKWKEAKLDMELYNEDGLRTLQQSIAQVKFPSGELLRLDENSLIILRPEKKREEIDLLSGAVRGSKTKILTDSSIVDPRIEARGPAPDFKTKIKQDKTTLVEVYEGIVDVTAQGRTVTLTKGFGTEVKYMEPPSLPHALPPRPELEVGEPQDKKTIGISKSKPVDATKVASDSLDIEIKAPAAIQQGPPGKIEDKKSKSKSKVIGKIVSKYHIQISPDTDFKSLVVDKIDKLKESINLNIAQYQLADGLYYYRIAYIDELDFEGQFSNPVQFIIDTTPPSLEVFPIMSDGDKDQFIHIEGLTEPSVTLKLDDKIIQVDENGRFMTALIPRKGETRYDLTARDRAGNISRETISIDKAKLVSRKQARKARRRFKEKGSTFFTISIAVLTTAVIVGVLILIAL
ncbi:MAG: LysM peptidoglycan-binding domain-containing protein [Endomicrobiales bacterium]|nr:LysM peptidoglycan-binding domain-containing protein [Endomicrobiales bacterium]